MGAGVGVGVVGVTVGSACRCMNTTHPHTQVPSPSYARCACSSCAPQPSRAISRDSPCLQPFWRREHVYASPSGVEGAGFGLFARRAFISGQIVCRYTGVLGSGDGEWKVDVGGERSIDAVDASASEAGRWANHSCVVNAKLYIPRRGIYDSNLGVHYVYLIAEDDIHKDSEIFLDYGPKYFKFESADPVYRSGLPRLLKI